MADSPGWPVEPPGRSSFNNYWQIDNLEFIFITSFITLILRKTLFPFSCCQGVNHDDFLFCFYLFFLNNSIKCRCKNKNKQPLCFHKKKITKKWKARAHIHIFLFFVFKELYMSWFLTNWSLFLSAIWALRIGPLGGLVSFFLSEFDIALAKCDLSGAHTS